MRPSMATPATASPERAGWVSCAHCSRRARLGQKFCELCGNRLEGETSSEASPRLTYRCEGCGAAVQVPEGERTATCAFCGAPYVRAGETSEERYPPEFVLPFTVPRRQAASARRTEISATSRSCRYWAGLLW